MIATVFSHDATEVIQARRDEICRELDAELERVPFGFYGSVRELQASQFYQESKKEVRYLDGLLAARR